MSWEWWLMLSAIAAGAASSAFGAVRNWQRARLIEDLPTSRIRSAAQGYVELSGFVRALDGVELPSPLTATPCVWFDFTIERYERRGKSSSWRTVERGRSERGFDLDDGTGSCVVDPRYAEVITHHRRRWYGHQRRPQGPPRPGSLATLLTGSRYRYTERWMAANEWLYALGWFETIHMPSGSVLHKERTRQLLTEWKRDREQLLERFDSNGDGEIDLTEWERAREAAARQAHHQVAREASNSAVHTLGRAPQRSRPYILATRDPEQLSRRYRRRALLLALVGLGLAALLLWLVSTAGP